MGGEHKGVGVDNFAGARVEVAWDTGSVVGNQGRALDPSSWRSREVLCFGEEGSQVCNLEVKVVNPGRERVTCGTGELLDGRIVRSERAGASWASFLNGPGGASTGEDFSDILLDLVTVTSLYQF